MDRRTQFSQAADIPPRYAREGRGARPPRKRSIQLAPSETRVFDVLHQRVADAATFRRPCGISTPASPRRCVDGLAAVPTATCDSFLHEPQKRSQADRLLNGAGGMTLRSRRSRTRAGAGPDGASPALSMIRLLTTSMRSVSPVPGCNRKTPRRRRSARLQATRSGSSAE